MTTAAPQQQPKPATRRKTTKTLPAHTPSTKKPMLTAKPSPHLDGCKDIKFRKPHIHLPWRLCEVPEPEPAIVLQKPPVGLRLPEPAIELVEFAFKGVGKEAVVRNNVCGRNGNDTEEAAKKTVVRRNSKDLSLDNENSREKPTDNVHHTHVPSSSSTSPPPVPAPLVNNVMPAQHHRFRGRSPPANIVSSGRVVRTLSSSLSTNNLNGSLVVAGNSSATHRGRRTSPITNNLVVPPRTTHQHQQQQSTGSTSSTTSTARHVTGVIVGTSNAASSSVPSSTQNLLRNSAESSFNSTNSRHFDRFEARIRFASPTSTHDHQISMPVAQDLSNFNTEKLIMAKRKLQCQKMKSIFSAGSVSGTASGRKNLSFDSAASQLKSITNKLRAAAASNTKSVITQASGPTRDRSLSVNVGTSGKRPFPTNLLSPRAPTALSPLGEPRRLRGGSAGTTLVTSSASMLPSGNASGGALEQIVECSGSEGGKGLLSSGSKLNDSNCNIVLLDLPTSEKRSQSHDGAATATEDELMQLVKSGSDAESVILTYESETNKQFAPHKRVGSGSAKRSSSVPVGDEKTALEKQLERESEKLELEQLPEELVFCLVDFLTNKEKFMFCLAANRQMPHIWGVTVVHFTKQFEAQQIACCEAGVLTQIAAQEKEKAGEKWRQAIERREMFSEDHREFARNEERFEVELEAMREEEGTVIYAKFAMTVKLLQQTMVMWDDKCKLRAEIATMCEGFRKALGMVFALRDDSIAVGQEGVAVLEDEVVAANQNGEGAPVPESSSGSANSDVDAIALTIEEVEGGPSAGN